MISAVFNSIAELQANPIQVVVGTPSNKTFRKKRHISWGAALAWTAAEASDHISKYKAIYVEFHVAAGPKNFNGTRILHENQEI